MYFRVLLRQAVVLVLYSSFCEVQAQSGTFSTAETEPAGLTSLFRAGTQNESFLHQGNTMSVQRASISSSGDQGDRDADNASISADGRFVAFHSEATNLVPGDTNGMSDVFVYDREKGETTRVSVSSQGVQGNGPSFVPSTSADGRFVAFHSSATNLVSGDTNRGLYVFVHDREEGETTLVSVSSEGMQSNAPSLLPSISADGRFVAFYSGASNLVPGDTNGENDVFMHDREEGETTRVSVSSQGVQGNGISYSPSISADGRFVAFRSLATNLVPGDTNGKVDVFVRELHGNETTLVSVSSEGVQGDRSSWSPGISADGRFVAFHSSATNLVPEDTNGELYVFVHDREKGETTRVSVSSEGVQSNGSSGESSISADGRFVAFYSEATNLVPGDTNFFRDIFVVDRGAATGSIVASFFPQVADGGGFTTTFTFMQNSEDSVEGTLRLFHSDGTPRVLRLGSQRNSEFDLEIAPNGTLLVSTSDEGGEAEAGWASFESDSQVAGVATYDFRPEQTLSTTVSVLGGPSARKVVLPAQVGNGVNTGLAIANPTEDEVQFVLTATASGSLVTTTAGPLQLGSYEHVSRFISNLFQSAGTALPNNFEGTLTMEVMGVGALSVTGLVLDEEVLLLSAIPVVVIEQ